MKRRDIGLVVGLTGLAALAAAIVVSIYLIPGPFSKLTLLGIVGLVLFLVGMSSQRDF